MDVNKYAVKRPEKDMEKTSHLPRDQSLVSWPSCSQQLLEYTTEGCKASMKRQTNNYLQEESSQ